MAKLPTINSLDKTPVLPLLSDDAKPSHSNSSGPANSISRRKLIQMGAGAAAAIYVGAHSATVMGADTPSGTQTTAGIPGNSMMPKEPNIIVLMTDQERHHIHWPAGWT